MLLVSLCVSVPKLIAGLLSPGPKVIKGAEGKGLCLTSEATAAEMATAS